MLMDYTQKPAFLMKYKIQEGKNAPPDTAKLIKVNSFPSVEMSFQAACERLPLMSHTIVDIDTELHRSEHTLP